MSYIWCLVLGLCAIHYNTDFLYSSANAKKWEIELATLKNNNMRLTSALQESTANVEEWKRQLHSYKEENQRMKTKYIELEAAKGIWCHDIYASPHFCVSVSG